MELKVVLADEGKMLSRDENTPDDCWDDVKISVKKWRFFNSVLREEMSILSLEKNKGVSGFDKLSGFRLWADRLTWSLQVVKKGSFDTEW